MSLNQGVPGTSTERIDVYACTGACWTHDKPPVPNTLLLCNRLQCGSINCALIIMCSTTANQHIPNINRVSTNLTEQTSRRFPGDSRRDFKKNPGHLHCFGPLCNVPNLLHLMEHVMMSSNQRSSLCYSTDYNISYYF